MQSNDPGWLGRLAAHVIARPRRSWGWILLVSAVALMLATNLRVDPNMLRLLPPDHPSTMAMLDLQNTEGGVEILTIAVDGADPEKVDAFLQELVEKLEKLETVQYALYDIEPDLAWRIGMLQLAPAELAKIRDRLKGALNFGPAMLNPFIAAQWMDLGPQSGTGIGMLSSGATRTQLSRERVKLCVRSYRPIW